MQPQLCSRCKKNIAVVFITRQENGQNVNEGLCLKCAKKSRTAAGGRDDAPNGHYR